MRPGRPDSLGSSNTWLTSPMSFIAVTRLPSRDGDAGALLAAVLERVQPEVGQPRDVAVGGAGGS